jgi:hypothetical protein
MEVVPLDEGLVVGVAQRASKEPLHLWQRPLPRRTLPLPGRFRPQHFVTRRTGVTQVNLSQHGPIPRWKRPAHHQRLRAARGVPATTIVNLVDDDSQASATTQPPHDLCTLVCGSTQRLSATPWPPAKHADALRYVCLPTGRARGGSRDDGVRAATLSRRRRRHRRDLGTGLLGRVRLTNVCTLRAAHRGRFCGRSHGCRAPGRHRRLALAGLRRLPNHGGGGGRRGVTSLCWQRRRWRSGGLQGRGRGQGAWLCRRL